MNWEPAIRTRTLVCPEGPDNHRNSEGDILRAADGTLHLAYTRFTSGAGDFDRAHIAGRQSIDQGRSWTEPILLRENPTGLNAMCPSFLDLEDCWLMIYLRKNARDDCSGWLTRSFDGGTRWTEDEIPVTTRPGYWVIENARLRRLASGRLLTAGAHTVSYRAGGRFRAIALFSDDQGASWSEGNPVELDAPWGALEPDVAELPGGQIIMILRTSLGCPWITWSEDQGTTWSPPRSTGLRAPNAPHTLSVAPDGSLLLLYNDAESERTPLSIARSSDEGANWTKLGDLADDPDRRYGYASCLWDGDDLLATWYESPPGPPPGACELIFARIQFGKRYQN